MKKTVLLTFLGVCLLATQASAHFGMIIPSRATVSEKSEQKISFEIAFAHPMEGNGMHMDEPRAFFVSCDKKKQDLKGSLSEAKFFGHKSWKASYSLQKPGVYQFAFEPAPYFEPAEDKYIVHYTKTIIPAFGEEEGWDEAVGLPTEIVPLTRPFGNYAGNVFQGQVLLNGKAVAGCEVEVEYYNKNKDKKAPNDYFVTQVVKTDANGVFTYAVPWAGWWGFAALNTAPEKLDYKGEQKEIEMGAVLWVEFARSK